MMMLNNAIKLNVVEEILFVQRNRTRRLNLDLSKASVTQIMYAYQEKRNKTNPKYSLQGAIGIIKSMEQAEKNLLKEEWPGPYLPIDICSEFWVSFEKYYVNTPSSTGRKRHASSAETYANQIIASLAWSQTYGAQLDPTFRDKKFSHYSKKKVTPSQDQISLIYHYDLDVKENRIKIRALAKEMGFNRFSFTTLKKVRDHFVLSCSIGQRISDSKRIDKLSFSNDIYEATQQKTGNKAKVDLKECSIDYDVVKEILEKYNYKAPAYGIDTGNFNNYLHLLCRAIGGSFNRVIVWEYKEGNEIKRESAFMWQLMSSHVARRTFITFQLETNKQSLSKVMSESGHADTRNLHKYFAPEHQ